MAKDPRQKFEQTCPVPLSDYPRVLLAHGGGGRLMKNLIEKMFLSVFDETGKAAPHDAALVEVDAARLAFTTDSYVIDPLFFPGGDIGTLAIYGTVNDLAMAGAEAKYLSAGFILEEGLAMETLWRIVQSMGQAAFQTGVRIVTGDTKVVERGSGDKIFINTSGLGVVRSPGIISPETVEPGDTILLSGDIGRHGIAVLASRAGIDLSVPIESDLADLAPIVSALLSEGIELHCMRDLTRGGLSAALNEIALGANLGMEIAEEKVPVEEAVKGACELLGFDPMYVANEGRFVAFVIPSHAERALEIIRAFPPGEQAGLMGRVLSEPQPPVTVKTRIGTTRILDMLSGEQLPRIC